MGHEKEAESSASEQPKASSETAMTSASTAAPTPSWFTPKRYLRFRFWVFRIFCYLGLKEKRKREF